MIRLAQGEVDLERGVTRVRGVTHTLTPLEAKLLRYLVSREGETVPREDLLEHVWGYRREMVTRTVDNNIGRLRAKIEVDIAAPEHLLTVVGEGYRLVPARPPTSRPVHGREALIEGAVRRLREGSPFLLLLGPGGIGKTTIAASLCERTQGRLVPLHEARTAMDVMAAVVRVIPAEGGDWIDAVVAAVQRAGVTLLVLDTLERLDAERVALVGALAAGLGPGRLLGTSRRRLHVPGEVVIDVPPLEPEAARSLYAARARAARDGAENDAGIAELVDRLDGIPLAIELSAARAGSLSARDIRSRLENILVDPLPEATRPERHQSLEATLRWSWDLISPAERDMLGQLCVFVGPASLDSLEAVVRVPDQPVWKLLAGLVDHSLLGASWSGGAARYRLLDSVRAFVVTVAGSGGAEARHRDWFLGLLTKPAATWIPELEDIVAATAAAEPARSADALLALVAAADESLPMEVLETLATRAVAAADEAASPRLEGATRLALARCQRISAHGSAATDLLERAMILSDGAGDVHTQVMVRRELAIRRQARLRIDESRALLEEALALAEAAEEPVLVSESLIGLGIAHMRAGATGYGAALFLRAEQVLPPTATLADRAKCRLRRIGALFDAGEVATATALLETLCPPDDLPMRIRAEVLDRVGRSQLGRGEFQASLANLTQVIEASAPLRWTLVELIARTSRCLALAALGREEDARADLGWVRALVRHRPSTAITFTCSVLSMVIAHRQGRAAEARAHAQVAAGIHTGHGDLSDAILVVQAYLADADVVAAAERSPWEFARLVATALTGETR